MEDPQNILVYNIFRLDCMSMPSQNAEGKNRVVSVIISDNEDNKGTFLTDCEYSNILDDSINDVLECYLNLSEVTSPILCTIH